MDDLEKTVMAFVARRLGCVDLSLESRLECEGDDARDLLENFGKEFGVDLGLLYEFWDRHFNSEGMSGGTSRNWLVPITVADMVRAARTKRWPEPAPSERPPFSIEH